MFVYNKTPRDTVNNKPYIEAGLAYNSMNGHMNDKLKKYDIGAIDNDPQLGYDLGVSHLVAGKVRIAWVDPSTKEAKNIWEVKWDSDIKTNQGQAVTKVSIREGFKQIIFVFSDYIVGLRQHFEYNYNHFNYVLDPSKLEESQKVMDKDHYLNIQAIVESTVYSV